MSTKIPAAVSGSYIDCGNRVAGAQGSFNDVLIRATFEDGWRSDDSVKSIVASFTDAHGENTYAVLLLPSMLVAGENDTYDIPIPAGAKKYEGDISLVLTGYSQTASEATQSFSGDGGTEEFTFTGVAKPLFVVGVSVGGTPVPDTGWSYSYSSGKITFVTAPASGTNNIVVTYISSSTSEVLQTANCFMRVLPADYTVVADEEISSSVVEQMIAEFARQAEEIAGKAPRIHTHTQTQITDLPHIPTPSASLAGKVLAAGENGEYILTNLTRHTVAVTGTGSEDLYVEYGGQIYTSTASISVLDGDRVKCHAGGGTINRVCVNEAQVVPSGPPTSAAAVYYFVVSGDAAIELSSENGALIDITTEG